MSSAKRSAAKQALNYVSNNMIVGLGTGSTAKIFVELLAQKVLKQKMLIKTVATSSETYTQAKKLGLPLIELDDCSYLDIVVDGADEIGPDLSLIKGGGGALLQEKIVASSSKKVIIIADQKKLVMSLGLFPLPVEIVKFGYSKTLNQIMVLLKGLGYSDLNFSWRMDKGNFFITDENHYILDLSLEKISDPVQLEKEINCLVGVVDSGLFVNTADLALVGSEDGSVEVIDKVVSSERI